MPLSVPPYMLQSSEIHVLYPGSLGRLESRCDTYSVNEQGKLPSASAHSNVHPQPWLFDFRLTRRPANYSQRETMTPAGPTIDKSTHTATSSSIAHSTDLRLRFRFFCSAYHSLVQSRMVRSGTRDVDMARICVRCVKRQSCSILHA